MDHDAVLLTQSGVEKLKQEKEQLINVERPKVDVYKRQLFMCAIKIILDVRLMVVFGNMHLCNFNLV